MLYHMIKTLERGYRNIRVITDGLSAVTSFRTLMPVESLHIQPISRSSYLHEHSLVNAADLLVIDLDSYSPARVSYLIFLAKCLTPNIPQVLITSNPLSDADHHRYIGAGVLEIIQLARPSTNAIHLQTGS